MLVRTKQVDEVFGERGSGKKKKRWVEIICRRTTILLYIIRYRDSTDEFCRGGKWRNSKIVYDEPY